MITLSQYIERLSRLSGLSLIILGLSLSFLLHFNVKAATKPVSTLSNTKTTIFSDTLASEITSNQSTQKVISQIDNPLQTAFINAFPSSDGTSILVSVSGVQNVGQTVFLNVDPGLGGGGHNDSYAMILSGTNYLATAIGFTPGQDVGVDGDDTLYLTSTIDSQMVSAGEVNFVRAYVEPQQNENIFVENNQLEVDIPNENTFSGNTYLLVMSTNAPPTPLLPGYRFASKVYTLSASGATVQTDRPVTLKFRYQDPLPDPQDPHTLAIAKWNPTEKTWDDFQGMLFDDNNQFITSTTKLGIYALAISPTWHDSFKELSLSGISTLENTQWGPKDTVILTTNALSGSVTSIPITAANEADTWGTIHFSATTPVNTSLKVDLLDPAGQLVLADISSEIDLDQAGISLDQYPSLKLQARLASTVAGETPRLHEWQINWRPEIAAKPVLDATGIISVSNSTTTQIRITGKNFTQTSELRLGDLPGLPLETTFVNSQTLQGIIPTGLMAGNYDIIVVNPDGQFALWPEGLTINEGPVYPNRIYLPLLIKI